MPEQTTTTRETAPAPARGSDELLRETLKRCSKETLDAAIEFRRTGDVALVSKIVLGIIERAVEPDLVDQLKNGGDSVRFIEDLNIDSIDMIEAIMMVEEAMGISIKNEELINLRSIGDMNRFIHEKISGMESSNKAQFFPFEEVAAILPHQKPFLFLHEASLEEHSATGKYRISGDEDFLEGHFKGNPVFPASLMLEALGQLAVFLLMKRPPEELALESLESGNVYFTGADGVRCYRVCKPGDTLEMSVKLKRLRDPLAVFSGQIKVDGEKTATAEEVTLAFKREEGVKQINGENGSATIGGGVNGSLE